MLAVSKKKQKPDAVAKRRNVVFITIDDATEAALQEFIEAQRIKPDRASVGLAAMIELLEREGFLPRPDAGD